ncbi:MAG: GAF domain-containing protein, partial [Candidatus Krumholzibacteria bacterium]|nr:GAF domain-containing protein [Candidatus Krumholzibacteria bacterium]
MSDRTKKPSSTSRLNAELLAMVRIASTILQHTELDDILAAITRELSLLVDFDRSSIALMESGGRHLSLQHIYKEDVGGERIGEGRPVPL